MRHIPEEELHAYLDQALSRSQCIEIETHLARCALCHEGRDDIAALRDRTTALLAKVAPRVGSRPQFSTLMAQAQERRRTSWRRTALWAASLGGLLLAGWAMRTALVSRTPMPAVSPQTVAQIEPAPAQPDVPRLDPIVVNPEQPASAAIADPGAAPLAHGPATGEPEVRLTAEIELRPDPPGQALPEAPPVPVILALDAGWTGTTLSEAETATGGLVPLIPDLPVVGVQIRPAGPQERPLIIVTQRHSSGVEVFTVEGPVADVAEVVASQLDPDRGLTSSEPARSQPDYVEAGPAFQRTSRVLAVLGRLPVDSLNGLAGMVVLR
ncbi:MAG TPA: hypothetical protein VGA42_03985 [Gemmatimonadales bacterium]